MCVINWLNANAGAITAIATVALAIITFIYVRHTSRLASGSDKTNARLQELSNALTEGQKLQDEANLLKYFELQGSKITNKSKASKVFPNLNTRIEDLKQDDSNM